MSASPSGADFATAWLEHSPFARVLGVWLERRAPDVADVVLPYDESLATYGDVLRGGALGSLVDIAAAMASWSAAEVSDSPRGATISMTVDFVSAARGSDVRALARVVGRGSSICFVEIELLRDDRDVVGKALVTYKVS